jgi:hypothetical protein
MCGNPPSSSRDSVGVLFKRSERPPGAEQRPKRRRDPSRTERTEPPRDSRKVGLHGLFVSSGVARRDGRYGFPSRRSRVRDPSSAPPLKAPDFRGFLVGLDYSLSMEVLRFRTLEDVGGTSETLGEIAGIEAAGGMGGVRYDLEREGAIRPLPLR